MMFNPRIAVGAFWVLVVSQLAIGGNPFLPTTPPAQDRSSIYRPAAPGEGGGAFAPRSPWSLPSGTDISLLPGAPAAVSLVRRQGAFFLKNLAPTSATSAAIIAAQVKPYHALDYLDASFGSVAVTSGRWQGSSQTGGAGGEIVGGVNTLTGRHNQSIAIGAVQATGGLTYPIALSYSAPHPMGLNLDPRFSPSYNAGYGWSLEFPFIATNHKGTTDPKDDEFIAYLGVYGGGGVLVPSTTPGEFVLENNPNISVRIAGETANSLFIETWIVKLVDGTEIVFGGRSDALRKTYRNGLKVGITKTLAETNADGWKPIAREPDFIYRWDITEVRSPKNRGIIRFEWGQYFNRLNWVVPNPAYGNSTRESWPSSIWSAHPNFTVNSNTQLADFSGVPIILDKISFVWGSKGADEVFPHNVIQGDLYRGDQVSTKYLQKVVTQAEGKQLMLFDLSYDFQNPTESGFGTISGKKRQLRQVIGAPTSTTPESDKLKWVMEYDANSGGWLSKFVTPNRVMTTYEFQSLASGNMGSQGMDPEAAVAVTQEPLVINPPRGFELSEPYRPDVRGFYYHDAIRWPISNDYSQCIGEFCYLIANRKPTREPSICGVDPQYPCSGGLPEPIDAKVSVKVFRKSVGSMRSVFEKNDFNGTVIPQVGYFISFQKKTMDLSVYQWDGSQFIQKQYPFLDDPRVSSYKIEEVIPSGGDYFLVRLKSNGSDNQDIVPVVRGSNGEWITLNRDKSACEINNFVVDGVNLRGNDGAYRPDDGQCMEFTPMGSWDKVVPVAATPDYFVVAHGGKGILQVFRRSYGISTRESPSFINETLHFLPGDIGGFRWDYTKGVLMPWNLESWHPVSVFAGKDYFVVYNGEREQSFFNKLAIHVWTWDGNYWTPTNATSQSVWNIYTEDKWLIPPVSISQDGIAIATSRGALVRSSLPGQPNYSATLPPTRIGPDENNTDYKKHIPKTSTTENYVAFYYADSSGKGTPMTSMVNGVSRNESYLVYGAGTIMDLTGGGSLPKRLFDIHLSPTEDWLVGSYLDGNRCDFYYVPLAGSPKSSTSGQMPEFSKWVKIASAPVVLGVLPKITFGPGVWMLSYHDTEIWRLKAEFRTMYSTGPVARYPQHESKVVSSVTTRSLYQNHQGTASQKLTFTYGSGMDLVYNGLSRQPESRITTVKQFGKNGGTFSTRTIKYYSDRLSAPLAGGVPVQELPPNSQFLAGQIESDVTLSLEGTKTTITPSYQMQMKGLSREMMNWAPGVARILPVGSKTVMDDRGTTSTVFEEIGNFDPNVNLPQVKASWVANNNGEGTQYRHRVEVTKYTGSGRVERTLSALYKNRSDAQLLLDYANNQGVYGGPWENMDRDVFDKKAIRITRDHVTYAASPDYIATDILSTYKWGWKTRGVDPTQFGTGQVADPDRADLVSTISAQRSPTGAPQFTTDNTTGITTSYVYEGPRGLPSAVAVNALPNNVAVLTAEDGQWGLNGTFNSYWKNPTTGSNLATWELGGVFDDANPHTGRYSIKLSGPANTWAFGPTHNMYFKNVPNWSSGLTATVWMYSTGVRPVFHAEAHVATNAEIGSFDGSPVGGTFIPNTWQQWKMEIPKSALMVPYGSGQKLFSSDAVEDYLRMWVGFNTPSAGTIWVDDFVIVPTESRVAVTSYDHAGRVIGSIDPDGRVARKEYGVQGEVQAVRDERGRIYGQSGVAGKGGN